MVRKDALACSTVDRARYSSAKPRTRGGDLLPRRISAFIAVVAATASTTALLASNGAAAPANTAFKALSGSTAANYKVSADMKLVRKLELGRGTYERYQQVYGAAFVLGGQISIYRNASGAIRTVIGSRYSAITPRNSVKLSKTAAFRRPPGMSARPGSAPLES